MPEVVTILALLEDTRLIGQRGLLQDDYEWPDEWRLEAADRHRGLATLCDDDAELALLIAAAWERADPGCRAVGAVRAAQNLGAAMVGQPRGPARGRQEAARDAAGALSPGDEGGRQAVPRARAHRPCPRRARPGRSLPTSMSAMTWLATATCMIRTPPSPWKTTRSSSRKARASSPCGDARAAPTTASPAWLSPSRGHCRATGPASVSPVRRAAAGTGQCRGRDADDRYRSEVRPGAARADAGAALPGELAGRPAGANRVR